MKRLTTRSIATATAIRDREDFKTSGSLRGEAGDAHGMYVYTGRLNETEREALLGATHVDYVVFSYDTPIAWHSESGWHVVDQKFSPTTSKHQGNLYLIPNEEVVTSR